ncbi:hypothetical protein Pcinc_027290 [Petrolisthes cinctipes]|uniref:Uncharacterized protein n=1 Tax=Petrolisthes cinctipes TaxID=88211 RepID=A0AAE1KB20_PETCI|nr:hypothetical protein Pcinc_027290 [Petrolisthes cinctipes]
MILERLTTPLVQVQGESHHDIHLPRLDDICDSDDKCDDGNECGGERCDDDDGDNCGEGDRCGDSDDRCGERDRSGNDRCGDEGDDRCGEDRCGDASNETEEPQTTENEPEGRGRRLGDIQESEEGGVSEEVVTHGRQDSPLTDNNNTDHQESLCHNNFGIVDYLNAVMKFQEGDQEDGDSHCGDYGRSLGVSPPGRFSDTESLIEPMAVSSDFPLNKQQQQQQFTPTFTDYRRRRKIEELKSVRWRSCQELTLPRWLPGVLKRQTSDEAIKVLQRKQSSFMTLVKVYDGNLGVSVLSVSDPVRCSSPSSSSSPRVTEDRKYLDHNKSKPSCILESESVAQPSLIHGSSQSPRRRTNDSSVNQSERKGDDGPDVCDGPVEAEATTNPENKRTKLLPTTSPPPQQQQYQLFSSVSPSQKSYSGHLATSDNQNTRLQRRRCCKERPQQDFKVSEANDIKVKHKGAKRRETGGGGGGVEEEVDQALGIQNDDDSGPGLSDEEPTELQSHKGRQSPLYMTTSSSPHQLLWNLTKDSHHRINESSVHRLHPRLSDTGKTASKAVLIAPPDYRLRSSGRERSGKQAWSGGQGRVYSGTSTGGGTSCSDGEGEESDTGMELSDLERCVLNLSHRRSQLRRQDTNAFLIAPPEFKITENSSSTFHSSPKGFLR